MTSFTGGMEDVGRVISCCWKLQFSGLFAVMPFTLEQSPWKQKVKLSNGQKSHPRGGRWLYFRHFHQSGTQSKLPQTAGWHFIGPPPRTDSWNCVAVVCTATKGFLCWGCRALSGEECPSAGEGNWPDRLPETRGDRAGWAGLSGWAEHVTLPSWLGVGWEGLVVWGWNRLSPLAGEWACQFLSPWDPEPTREGISVAY